MEERYLLKSIFSIFKYNTYPMILKKYEKDNAPKKPKNPITSKEGFLRLITCGNYLEFGSNYSALFNVDIMNSSMLDEIKYLISDHNVYNKYIKGIGYKFCDELNIELINLIKIDNTYSYKTSNNSEDVLYDKAQQGKLYDFLYTFKDSLSVGDILYYMMFFYVYKKNPPMVNNRSELLQFDKNILSMYGARADSAVSSIISMATSEDIINIYALYEYADMLYYGNTRGVTQDFNMAVQYYKKAAGLNTADTNLDASQVAPTKGHPLAFWSLAFIYYNYGKKGDRLEKAYIDEIHNLTLDERIKQAILYAQHAIKISECAGAYNILGNISFDVDDKKRKELGLEPALNYYEIAARKNYLFGYNNVAKCYLRMLINNPDSKEKDYWLSQYVSNLQASSDMNNNYASNTLGKFFAEGGITYIRDGEKQLIDARNWILKNCLQTTSRKPYSELEEEKELAVKYYRRGFKYILDGNSAWAIANLLITYPEEFDDTFSDKESRNKLLNKVGNLGNTAANNYIIENHDKIKRDCLFPLIFDNKTLNELYNK